MAAALTVEPSAALLTDPVVEALAGQIAADSGEPDEEAVGFQVMRNVKRMILGMSASPHHDSSVDALAGGQDPGTTSGEQQNRVATVPAWRLEAEPSMDEMLIREPLDASLRLSATSKEEGLDLRAIQIPILVESSQDGDISCGQRAE